MRITFASVEDFCAELRHLAGEGSHIADGLWQRQVRYRIDANPEQDEAISFKIGLWLTALGQTAEGEYVLEYADLCGSDDPENKPKDAGTLEAKRRIEQVAMTCKDCNLTMLPGKIEQF